MNEDNWIGGARWEPEKTSRHVETVRVTIPSSRDVEIASVTIMVVAWLFFLGWFGRHR